MTLVLKEAGSEVFYSNDIVKGRVIVTGNPISALVAVFNSTAAAVYELLLAVP